MGYQKPAVMDFGSIAEHTFDNPGAGDKNPQPMVCDKFGEFSHPSGEGFDCTSGWTG